MSAKSIVGRPSSFSKATERTAAPRARSGQLPPTASAIASNGRHLSAARLKMKQDCQQARLLCLAQQ
jgi:hypothetical protein